MRRKLRRGVFVLGLFYKNMKTKLYVGCALGGLKDTEKEEFLKQIVRVKEVLRTKGFDVLEFMGLGDQTPLEVYEHDILHCVATCDAMLAVCDHPSTGMGYEMATVIEKRGLPVLVVAHKDAFVSKIVRGVTKPNFHFEYYTDFEKEIPVLAEKYLKKSK